MFCINFSIIISNVFFRGYDLSKKNDGLKFSIDIKFENIKFPPFDDILVLTKKCPHGVNGVKEALKFISSAGYEAVILNHSNIEAVFINKKLLKRLDKGKIIEILEEKVFPHIIEGDLVKVDLNIKYSYENLKYSF